LGNNIHNVMCMPCLHITYYSFNSYQWQSEEMHYFSDKHHLKKTEISSIQITCLSLSLFCRVVRKVEHEKSSNTGKVCIM